jgi:molybdopterin adenylyltransferase
MLKVGVLTMSDKGHRGERVDKSGPVLQEMATALPGRVVRYEIIPDEAALISAKLANWADSGEIDVILTTGGTGLAPRDVTPEATLSILDKIVPGIPEYIRLQTAAVTPLAVLSRAVAGVRKQCLIINFPGNPKAVRECFDVVLPVISHAVGILQGTITEHPGHPPPQEAGPHAH